MNDIPAAKPNTVSIYLSTPEGKPTTDLTELYVSQVTVLEQGGALIWVDPIGHVQIGEQVLLDLLGGIAEREAARLAEASDV